jgi:hypothetical protein
MGVAGQAATGHGAAGAGRPDRGAGASSAVREPALPDTVLARVGNGRQVTASAFLGAWNQLKPPARPDSLTPQGAREFLKLLVGKEALAEAALREPWVWTADESAGVRGLRDRLVMGAVLDSALEATRLSLRAAGDTISDPQVLGVVARDSLVAGLDVRWDEPLLQRLARAWAAIPRPPADSSITAKLRMLGAMPNVDAADVPRAVAEGRTGPYTVAELLDAWRHLNPLYRPRVDASDQVRDLVRNGLYERELRRDAARRRIEEWPAIAGALAREREFIAINHLVAREVYSHLDPDSTALARTAARHAGEWALPMRVRLTRLVLPDRAGATQLALRLRDPAEAESLVERGHRSRVEYRVAVSEHSDSLLFHRALRSGAGTVLGPDSLAEGWAVARVDEIQPSRPRTFSEARPFAYRTWYDETGERMMSEFLDRLRAASRVTINTRALDRMAKGTRMAKGLTLVPPGP